MVPASQRWVVLGVLGVLSILAAVLADVVGIGWNPGFGWKQTAALVVGLALLGGAWHQRPR